MEALNIQRVMMCLFKRFCPFQVVLYDPSADLASGVNLLAVDQNLTPYQKL